MGGQVLLRVEELGQARVELVHGQRRVRDDLDLPAGVHVLPGQEPFQGLAVDVDVVVDDGVQDVVLGLEIIIERSLCHAYFFHDVADRRLPVALFAEQRLRRLDQLAFPYVRVLRYAHVDHITRLTDNQSVGAKNI